MRLAGSEIDQVTGPLSAFSVIDAPSSGMGTTLVGATVRGPCAGWLDALALALGGSVDCGGGELLAIGGGELLAIGGELLAIGGELLAIGGCGLLAIGGELLVVGDGEAGAEPDGAVRTAADAGSPLPELPGLPGLPEPAVGGDCAAPARPLAPGEVAAGAALGLVVLSRPVTGLMLVNLEWCFPPDVSSTVTPTATTAVPAAAVS
jgi:hypothetical protein